MDMKKINRILDARPVQFEILTAEAFLRLTKDEKRGLDEIRIAPPRLGSSSFGGLVVKYKTPVYKVG